MSVVKKLRESVINKIRCGLSLPNLIQCIEELILNSLDANCTSIKICYSLNPVCIEILDNGVGIHPEDFDLVGTRYATSKLPSTNYVVPKKYGYRGEALASIAELSSHLEILSLYQDEVNCKFKCIGRNSDLSCVNKDKLLFNGTRILVRGFLEEFPIRSSEVNMKTEEDRIIRIVQHLSLLQPQVAFTLCQGSLKSPQLEIPSHSSRKHRLQSNFYREVSIQNDFTTIKLFSDGVAVECEFLLRWHENNHFQFVFANDRILSKDHNIFKFVEQLINKVLSQQSAEDGSGVFNTKTLGLRNQHAVFCIYIRCPAKDCDANGPFKRVLSFVNERGIRKNITNCIRRLCKVKKISWPVSAAEIAPTYENADYEPRNVIQSRQIISKQPKFIRNKRKTLSVGSITDGQNDKIGIKSKDQNWTKKFDAKTGRQILVNKHTGQTKFYSDFAQDSTIRFQSKGNLAANKTRFKKKCKTCNSPSIMDSWKNPAFIGQSKDHPLDALTTRKSSVKRRLNETKITKKIFETLEVIGQVDKKFLLCTCKTNGQKQLLMFDQHAVHERIRLENLIKNSYTGEGREVISATKLAKPLTIKSNKHLISNLLKWKDEFKTFGLKYIVKEFCDDVAFTSVPSAFVDRIGGTSPNVTLKLVQELITEQLNNKANLSTLPKAIFSELCSQACRGAIMFGDELSRDKCKQLLFNLSKCNLPFQCAHGRLSVCLL